MSVDCPACDEGRVGCGWCSATGIGQSGPPDASICYACRGHGDVPCETCDGLGILPEEYLPIVCPDCLWVHEPNGLSKEALAELLKERSFVAEPCEDCPPARPAEFGDCEATSAP